MSTVILHVTDTHLGASGGPDREVQGERAWQMFLDHVAATDPDLVVVTGDIVVDDPDDTADQKRAFELLAGLPVPFRVVPGNHDVGDHAVRAGLPADWHGKVVTSERVRDWNRRWGADYWLFDLGYVTCIGLNSQLIGSGLPEEQSQLLWLESVMSAQPERLRPLLVFTHEALIPGEGVDPDSWIAAPTLAAERVRAILAKAGNFTVFSGHTHRFLDVADQQFRQVTAPSLSGPIPLRGDMTQARGDRRPGWVEIAIDLREVSVQQKLLSTQDLAGVSANSTTTAGGTR
ncbi:metallophosphoesterase [Leucobacter sp. UT-8R-CII-1-4]|uniref:metallophosphoesterase family protein n=1 Tax=Leucobacter sp. UT-8R-CII-1-4 TaxID=3040075 RepID=UPI0024A924B7|nr:metallophosphoesterase [Leucobacter sp. UT-8R-CII-1-4]MDI6022853.1 metallophosphoesterase [Leucobacter sp. UT-8R-CII-1-4]